MLKHSLNEVSVGGACHEGLPEKGVLSPLLWCFVVCGILQTLNKIGCKKVGYADDVAIVISGKLEGICQR